MKTLSRSRRFIVAAIALATASVLFRGQLAAAVVTRGDDALRTGDVSGAIRFYRRAVGLDARSIVAGDRLAFHLALQHNRASARAAVAIATRALVLSPAAALFADRAFAELQLRSWRDAERDFDRAGSLAHDARYEHFAGRMALRSGDERGARHYALLALADDPSFAPARSLLRTLR